jgi:tricorn protease
MPKVAIRMLACLVVLAGARGFAAETRLLRFPDVHAERLVFCYAGDLWTASTAGGTATRLTAHPGLEIFPRFSPDGEWIAFTGQYDGDEQVYVIPAAGGVPKQLTWYPSRGPLPPRWGWDHQVFGWTRDGKHVLFRSLRDTWNLGEPRVFRVAATGGPSEPLPMPVSGACDLSPDGKRAVYSPTAREFRTWKRYQGGWAQDLYLYDLATHDIEQITQEARSDRDPMWIGDAIYFTSDRDGTLNLYVYDLKSKATRQLTEERQYDVRWPSSDWQSQIVYELNGVLHLMDLRAGRAREVAITVPNDGVAMRPRRVDVDGSIESFDLSPKGERALFVARGDIFTLPIEKGPTRNLTRSSDAHEKWARWSPDGRKIACISDRSGEEEVWLLNQDGDGEPEQLTRGGKAMRYAPEWSPDGAHLAFSDKNGKLYVLTLAGRRLQEIADEPNGMIRDYTWAPDSRWLAFSMTDENSDLSSIHLWGVADGKLHRVGDDLFDENTPAWDPEGNYLYYLSRRNFAPQLMQFEWNYAPDRTTGIFALALRKDVEHPFPPQSDEVTIADEKPDDEAKSDAKDKKKEDKKKDDKKDGDKEKPKPIAIDFDGLAARAVQVPVGSENYSGLSAVKGHLLYVKSSAGFYGREAASRPELRIYDLKERKETTLVEKAGGYAVSLEGNKLIVDKDGAYEVMDATPKGKDGSKSVSVKGMKADIVPAEEWATIFDEVWRRYRDFFYVTNMHGYDWEALGKQYRALLPHVGHRSDLNYVLGEMVAELNCSHAYIAGGDWDAPARHPVALPGARFAWDARAGRYRIARILRGENEEDRYRAPLTEVGVDARQGDFVLAIDGVEPRADEDIYRLLRDKSDRPVTLLLNDKPDRTGAREVAYKPITSESNLMYLDMVRTNRDKVAAATQGRVGYIHIPNMGGEGIYEFIKTYYAQIRKEGLVVDVRSNGGGNVSQMIIERLRRELLGTRFGRLTEEPGTYPESTFYGHMVCLLDENSSSDGDIFPHMFRQARLGPLIGKRSWGGVVGITGHGPLLDGGQVSVPQSGTNGVDGSWVIEGHGVDPDIEVTNDPKSLIAGRDPQLERGIEEVLRRMKETPRRLPPRPADPVKTK